MKKLLVFFLTLLSVNLYANSLEVMSYNVENLFDTEHDTFMEGQTLKEKKDWSFLPKNTKGKEEACKLERNKHHKKECLSADWTAEKLDMKISNISDVISKDRSLPDFLGLIEVENLNVVKKLAAKLGFDLANIEMTNSPDERGIDVALLYKKSELIKKISMKEHLVPVDYATRNILEVEFLISGKYPLTLFVNHWPSLANPDSWRIKAAEVLKSRTDEILKANPEMSILAMGDFNTIDENNPHPFKTVLFKNDLFIDVAAKFSEDKSVDQSLLKSRPPGTYYFSPKDQWNHLDHFFMNKNLSDSKDLELNLKSFEIYSKPFFLKELQKKETKGDELQVKIVSVSKRFEADATTKEEMGYSDHFPITVKLTFPDVEVKEVLVKSKKSKKAKK